MMENEKAADELHGVHLPAQGPQLGIPDAGRVHQRDDLLSGERRGRPPCHLTHHEALQAQRMQLSGMLHVVDSNAESPW